MTGITQQRKPEVFDLTIGDSMMEVNRDTERELTERVRRRKQRQIDLAEGVSHANPTYVDELVKQAIPSSTAWVKGWNGWKTGILPPKPEFKEDWNGWKTGEVPASSQGGKAPKGPKTRKTPYGTGGSGKGKGQGSKNELVLHMQPGPPETPAGMAPPPDGKPPPSSGRGRIKKFLEADGTLVKGKFLKAKGENVRATLKAARDLKANSAPKLNPAPIPENLAPPPLSKREKAAKAAEARAAKRTKVIGKQSQPAVAPAAVAPEVAPAAKARAKSRSASSTPGAASSSPSAAAETTTVPPAETKTTKRIRSKSKPITPPIEVIVAPRPTRGRSIGTGPASRRIGSESKPPPIDPFAGPAQRLRSRTPAPKKTAAKEAASSSSVAAEETGESTGKARKMEVGASAGKKPLKIPSKIKTSQIAEELKDLVKNKGWNQKDADRLQVLQKRVEDDPSTARDSSIEMQVIYKRNFNNLKKAH
jgi:hypothetical protein